MSPAFSPATAGNVVMPTVITPGAPTNGRVTMPLTVQQPAVPSGSPQFVTAPHPQPSMFTQPPTVNPSTYQQAKGIDPELDKILCTWEGSPGANSAQYLGYVPQGGYPENANPPYAQAAVAGNTITCTLRQVFTPTHHQTALIQKCKKSCSSFPNTTEYTRFIHLSAFSSIWLTLKTVLLHRTEGLFVCCE